MKSFPVLKLTTYNFTNSKGQDIHTSKCILSLGEFGTIVLCSPLLNDIPDLSEVDVYVEYDKKYNKFVITGIN